MNTRCGWGGVARTSRDPVWCNKSTVISLANRRGRVGCWTLERQCGLVPIHATTPRKPVTASGTPAATPYGATKRLSVVSENSAEPITPLGNSMATR